MPVRPGTVTLSKLAYPDFTTGGLSPACTEKKNPCAIVPGSLIDAPARSGCFTLRSVGVGGTFWCGLRFGCGSTSRPRLSARICPTISVRLRRAAILAMVSPWFARTQTNLV